MGGQAAEKEIIEFTFFYNMVQQNTRKVKGNKTMSNIVTNKDRSRGFRLISLSSVQVGHKVRIHGGFFTVHELHVHQCSRDEEGTVTRKYVLKGRTNTGARVNRTFYESMRSVIGVML